MGQARSALSTIDFHLELPDYMTLRDNAEAGVTLCPPLRFRPLWRYTFAFRRFHAGGVCNHRHNLYFYVAFLLV